MIDEDKVELLRKRAELVAKTATPLSPEERVRVQGELSLVNAKIKAINTTTAAQLKAAADQRKIAGLEEARANAERASARVQAKISGAASGRADENNEPEDDDPGQTEAIDGWIDAVLLRSDVEFTRSRAGKVAIVGCDPRCAGAIALLIDGIYAAARGQELPDLPQPAAKTTKKPGSKPKKR